MSVDKPKNSAEAMEKLAGLANSGKLKVLGKKDTFPFKCTMCGKCCKTIDVMVSPYDVYELSRGLNKSIPSVIAEHIDIHRGHHSNMPIAMLRSVRSGHCEFLKENKCSIHEFSPKICKLYPLAAFTRVNTETGEKESGYTFMDTISSEDCEGIGFGSQSLEDFVKDASLEKYDEPSKMWNEFIIECSEKYEMEKLTELDFRVLTGIIFLTPELAKSGVIGQIDFNKAGIDSSKVFLMLSIGRAKSFLESVPYLSKK